VKFTIEQITKCIGDYLPPGIAWAAKRISTSNTYKLLKSVSQQVQILFSDFDRLKEEMDPNTTTELIDRWEKEYGIPDDIIAVAFTIPDRRNNVILKMAGLNISTINEFRALAARLGYTLTIDISSAIRFPPYSVPFYPLSLPGAYFLLIVTGDLSITNVNYFVNFMEELLPGNAGLLLIDTSI
jgi:uncharacterized protein YmfQ (DUF2313 family)